jgi:hypothetical protein
MFLKKTPFKVTFHGVVVTAVIAALEFEDLLDISGGADDNENVRRCAKLLPKYVEEFNMSDGTPLEDVCRYAYYQDLLADLGKALLHTGKPSDPVTPSAVSVG